MNWKIPEYAHIPLIHGEDGSKLSKRHGAVDVLEFKKNGYLKEAVINNIILLGWSPKNINEIISIKEITKLFKINTLSKSSSIFSYKKLNFFNNYYLRLDSGFEEFKNYCQSDEKLFNLYKINKDKMKNIFETYKKNLNNFSELSNIVDLYFNENYKYNNNEKFSDKFKSIYKDFTVKISNIEEWTKENIQKEVEEFISIKKIKFPVLGKPIRFILINSYNGPSISDIFNILGKKDSIERLNQYINKN